MKKLVLLSLIALFSGVLSAQNAIPLNFEINKGINVQGYVIDFSVEKSAKLVSDAFQHLLEKVYGLKSNKSAKVKGFTNYVNQTFSPVSATPVSIYFNVAEEGKKADKVTRLYIVVFDGGENVLHPDLSPTFEPKIYDFLNKFPAALVDYANNLKLKETQNLLEKQKKDLDKLGKEKTKIEKQLSDNATDIYNKEKEIADAENEINRLQNLLKK
ncbi:MAG: hypothetical protein LBS50_01300 [Prevotellaceae bacterium]|jgi:hypothetical protein|nr:hypothetical protein [Prevotellaceae bacterium]